jgi:hypothetical protein
VTVARRTATVVLALLLALALAVSVAGCGGSSSGAAVSVPHIAPARLYTLAGFTPASTVQPKTPVTISFRVQLPNGQTLTRYKTGSGPHTGVHLIIVRNDLRYIIHQHPPIEPGGQLSQTVTFPAPGPYRVLVDVYPNVPGGQPNFQLFKTIQVEGSYKPQPLPKFHADQTIDGYHIDMQPHAPLHAIQAAFVDVKVTDPHGHKVTFVPWFGALAHAIFFKAGSLDYFHTHVCAPGASNCSTVFGATRIAGQSTTPGKLTLGILLPVPGTWELFLQMKLGGHVVTAPFTLQVAS